MNAPAGYRVDAVDPAVHRADVLGVWRGNLGQEARMAAKYDWFYQGCPFGAPLLELMRHEPSGEWAGVAAAGTRRMAWRGREFHAGLLVDLAVTAAHRSLGPALALHHALIADGRERFGLLYGFPNRKAVPVCRRVGHRHLTDIVRYARVVRHRKYLGRRLPPWVSRLIGFCLDQRARFDAWRLHRRGDEKLVATWTAQAPSDADTLWADAEHGDEPIGVRDRNFLAWRFDANPLVEVCYLTLRTARDRRLRAWFACQVEENVLHVRDFWSHDAGGGISAVYVGELLQAVYPKGHDAVSVEYAGPASRLAGWQAHGFVERSRRPVYGLWFQPGRDAGLVPHLTSADEDE